MSNRLRTARVVGCVVALAGLAAALVSCGGSDAGGKEAERVAVRWLKEMAEGNVRAACQIMDAENHRRHSEFPNWSPAKSCQEHWRHSDNRPLAWKPSPGTVSIWGDDHPEVLKVDIEGDEATVLVDGVANEGRPVWLRKEHGRWLVHGDEYPI